MFRTTDPIQTPVPKFRIKWDEVAAFAAVCAVSVGVTLVIVTVALEASTSPSNAVTPACATEDSTNCFWDADSQGNGTGESFYVDAEGKVYYLPVAIQDSPEYQSVAECAKQLKGFSRDAMALSTELTGYWAQQAAANEDGALSNTTYGEWVITDNLQPMQDRYYYLVKTFCS